MLRYIIISLLVLFVAFPADAKKNPNHGSGNQEQNNNSDRATLREPCSPGNSRVFQDINNVRAMLLINGDCWWNGEDAQYIVPKPPAGEVGVSAIFAGAVWIGGFDDGGNLKLAAKTFGASNGDTDYWPGPINLDTAIADDVVCGRWDRHFEVLGTDIDLHIDNYLEAIENDQTYDVSQIPESILGWPAQGNEYFEDIYEFELPNTDAGLAGFEDLNDNGIYEPTEGDYPVIEVRGCEAPQYPDQMFFWIYNDDANVHTESTGTEPMKMEVQVQSFAYTSTDALNDMTFQRYKLINRGTEPLDSTFFAMWVDPDLGCAADDYVGCNIERSLAFIYNSDLVDGLPGGCNCSGTPTYCEEIPVLGVDYFRGPLDEFGEELGMSSFVYYNNGGGTPPPPQGTDDPQTGPEFYNYLSGSWRDGQRFTEGGNARGGTTPTNYVFPGEPATEGEWSMADEELANGDRRTIQASGPFRLAPGATNELIIGAVFVPDVPNHPRVNLTTLLFADDIAQAVFNNCFEIQEGPDPPLMDFVEMDQQLIALLYNNDRSNNYRESYAENDFLAPNDSIEYKFEGYEVYQLRINDEGIRLDDPDNARLVFKSDIKNGISTIYEWIPEENSSGAGPAFVYDEVIKSEGDDEGIKKSVVLTTDAFTNKALINNKKYYYKAIAYGYNNYLPFNPATGVGQQRQYIVGRKSPEIYTVIPRPITTEKLNSTYGEGPIITRLDGVGAGENFLDVTDESREAILNGTNDNKVVYKPGEGPIDINIVNPLEIREGDYQIHLADTSGNNVYDVWIVTDPDGNEIWSEHPIDTLYEQILPGYGFSVSLIQSDDAGEKLDDTNGTIGVELDYTDTENNLWFNAVPDQFQGPFDYVQTEMAYPVGNNIDPNQSFTTFSNSALVPFRLTTTVLSNGGFPYTISPAWDVSVNVWSILLDLIPPLTEHPNVDIVFTSDKSKWSRCVIVETAGANYYSGVGDPESRIIPTEGNVESFDLRAAPSVGKEAGADGNPVPDNDTDANGNPRMGMGWFPGYAINVETGKRLNIFFGENSAYDCESPVVADLCAAGAFATPPTGRDMMFNPTSEVIVGDVRNGLAPVNTYVGGQHYIYVSNTEYDECEEIYNGLIMSNDFVQYPALESIVWTSMPVLAQGTQMLSYENGLIPNDMILKARVDNSYQNEVGVGMNDGDPTYQFSFTGVAPEELTQQFQLDSALSQVNVVPNPYYGFSDYEVDRLTSRIKITNLPAKATITIYTLDGKFVRQYVRDEVGMAPESSDSAIRESQVVPDLEWDLRNFQNIPVASGVYLIHIDAPGYGQRVLKWFGVAREFDPTGL